MSLCGVCNERRSPFLMNNKLVCLHCDDLLFDIEIECEEERKEDTQKQNTVLLRVGTKQTRSSNG